MRGELNLAGGAVMCLAFQPAIDAGRRRRVQAFGQVRDAACASPSAKAYPTLAQRCGQGYLSDHGTFIAYLELSHLKVFGADARYMLAMKCLAMRIGEGYRDEEDIRYLLRNLGLESYDRARKILAAS